MFLESLSLGLTRKVEKRIEGEDATQEVIFCRETREFLSGTNHSEDPLRQIHRGRSFSCLSVSHSGGERRGRRGGGKNKKPPAHTFVSHVLILSCETS